MCILFHSWGKWIQYERLVNYHDRLIGKTFENIKKERQRRIFKKCGKAQDESLG